MRFLQKINLRSVTIWVYVCIMNYEVIITSITNPGDIIPEFKEYIYPVKADNKEEAVNYAKRLHQDITGMSVYESEVTES